MSSQVLVRDRFRGALLGLAVGDAVGTTVEFKAPGTFSEVTDMVGGGPFGLPAGAWTDDTSMALCLAESLVKRQGFDPVDQLRRYVGWYRNGDWSSTGSCFDIGNATRSALQRFERTGEAFPGDADVNAAGNGPLMKLAPVALLYAQHPEMAVKRAGDSARTTHGAPQAIDAARYFAGLLVNALNGAGVSQLLHQGAVEPVAGIWEANPLHPDIAAVAGGSFHAKEPPAIKGTGYVVDALEAALWSLARTRTFEDGVLAAVNLGDDADTTAAIYGQLAGALFGAEAIPAHWLEKLVMREEIVAMADALFELSTSVSANGLPAAPASAAKAASPARPAAPGDSFWVIDDHLLAGPYPGAPSRREARAKLEAFLDLGVTCFVDLTGEGEGPPLHPYSELLRSVAAKRKIRVAHLRMPIRDVDIPTSWQMRATLAAIRIAVSEGETVYLHCWGGVGRTGTVLGCLIRETGVSGTDALAQLKGMRSGTQRANRTSPETHEQRTFVEHWTASDTLVLDPQAIDRLGLIPEPEGHTPIPNRGMIIAALSQGSPVTIEGPGPGWCVQAVADLDADVVQVEVLDPEYWENGPPLPAKQQQVIEGLGFGREADAWRLLADERDGVSAVSRAADVMLDVTVTAWQVAQGA